jgi:hypothetical protein
MTKYHIWDDPNNRNSFSHTFGSQKSKIKISDWWGSGEGLSSWLAKGNLLPVSSQRERERERESTLVSVLLF